MHRLLSSDTNVYCAGNDVVGATGHAAGSGESNCSYAPFVTGTLKCTPHPTLVQGLP